MTLSHCNSIEVTDKHVELIYPIQCEIMRTVDAFLNSIKVKYVIDCGNLLSVIRNKYIVQDDDLDIRIYSRDFNDFEKYINEIRKDSWLNDLISKNLKNSKYEKDTKKVEFSRRIGWYAFARAIKPKIIIET